MKKDLIIIDVIHPFTHVDPPEPINVKEFWGRVLLAPKLEVTDHELKTDEVWPHHGREVWPHHCKRIH